MNEDLIRAQLNLYAVLQNLEDLVVLDAEMAALTKNWDVVIQFAVRNGPAAYLEFKGGRCKHGRGRHASPNIKLFFMSPGHLLRMFDGKANPIPLKGFTRLGFLQKEFTPLTERLEYYLKPEEAQLADETFMRINTTLTLFTAAHAVRELAELDSTCKKVAMGTPDGTLQISVLPDGPHAHAVFKGGSVEVAKGPVDKPSATMEFADLQAANGMLTGQLDAFTAVAEGKVILRGMLPMADNTGLILDRVEHYLA